MKGIYRIKIGDKSYIGKDYSIDKNKRLQEHLRLLVRNEHYNRYLQNAYNKHGMIEHWVVHIFEDSATDTEITQKEIEFIEKFDTFNNGYNLTTGGEGLPGFAHSELSKEAKSKYMSENNHQSKITKEQFLEIVSMLRAGAGNEEIGEKFNLHSRYVSLLRHKKRRKTWWDEIEDYAPEKSNKPRGKISYEEFKEIIALLKTETNKLIAEKYGVDKSTVSRIRTKDSYKRWWEAALREQTATTIESTSEDGSE